jgi:hypothetical protein
MVMIYTERGSAGEVLAEKKPIHFGQMVSISLGTALLLSLIAAYNLKVDTDNLVNQKTAYIQQQTAEIQSKWPQPGRTVTR